MRFDVQNCIIFFLVHPHINESMVFSCKTGKCWKTELSLWQPPPRNKEFPFQLEKGKASDITFNYNSK